MSHGRRQRMRAPLLPLLPLLLLLRGAPAQFPAGSTRYNESRDAAAAALTASLDALDVQYPAGPRPWPRTDAYVVAAPPAGRAYVQNVIFDPCRQHGHACCNDTYGTPEFTRAAAAAAALGGGDDGEQVRRWPAVRADGSPLADDVSRRPDDELVYDAACEGALRRCGGAPARAKYLSLVQLLVPVAQRSAYNAGLGQPAILSSFSQHTPLPPPQPHRRRR